MHTLTQLHIDITRNATDDFNLFHDPMRWQRISCNPFRGTIALGFQLGLYVEAQINQSASAIEQRQYSVYEFTFVNPAKVGDELNLVVKLMPLSDMLDKNSNPVELFGQFSLYSNKKPA